MNTPTLSRRALLALGLSSLCPVSAAEQNQSPWLDLSGRASGIESFLGKPIILNFWATWCSPCVIEIPEFNEAYTYWKKRDYHLVGVSSGESIAAVKAFMADVPIDFPVRVDKSGSAFNAWQITGLPTTLLLDPKGLEITRMVGLRHWGERSVLDEIDRHFAQYKVKSEAVLQSTQA